MMSIVSGTALILTGGLTRPLMVPGFNWIGSGRVFDVPVPLILMIVAYIVLSVVLRRTRFGRFVYAVGGNAEASRLIGLPVERVQMTLYVVSGISGAVAGTDARARMLGAAAPNAASPHLLTVIAAIILGGTSLYGGRGSVWGTLLAVLILGTLNNGLTLLDVSSFWQDVTRGIVLMLAVSLDQIRTRGAGRLTWSRRRSDHCRRSSGNSVADQVAKKILDLVRTGNLKPGDQLPPERDLAQMLQVSRPSVREALRGLQILGVVKIAAGRRRLHLVARRRRPARPAAVPASRSTRRTSTRSTRSRVLIDGGIARHGGGAPVGDADIDRLRAIVDGAATAWSPTRSASASPTSSSTAPSRRRPATRSSSASRIRSTCSAWSTGASPRRRRACSSQSLADHEAIVAALAARDRRRGRAGDGRAHAQRPPLDPRRHGEGRDEQGADRRDRRRLVGGRQPHPGAARGIPTARSSR